MADEQKGPQGTITVGDQVYKLEDLSDAGKRCVTALQFTEAELAQLKMRISVVETARNSYMKVLQGEVAKITPKQ